MALVATGLGGACDFLKTYPPLPVDERLPAPTPIFVAPMTGYEHFAGLSPDQRKVAVWRPEGSTGDNYGPLFFWDLEDNSVRRIAENSQDREYSTAVRRPWVVFDSRSERAVVPMDCDFLVAGHACDIGLLDLSTYILSPILSDITLKTWRAAPDLSAYVGLVSTSLEDGRLMLWDRQAGSREVAAEVIATSVAMSPAGDWIAYSVRGQASYALSVADGRLHELGKDAMERPLFSPDGRYLAYGAERGLAIYDLQTEKRHDFDAAYSAPPLFFATPRNRVVAFLKDPTLSVLSEQSRDGSGEYPLRFADLTSDTLLPLGPHALVFLGGESGQLFGPGNPTLSPDRCWLAYPANYLDPPPGHGAVIVVDLMTLEWREVPHLGMPGDGLPAFTFDSRKVVYMGALPNTEEGAAMRSQTRQYDLPTGEISVLSSSGEDYKMGRTGRRMLIEHFKGFIDTRDGMVFADKVLQITDYETGIVDEVQAENHSAIRWAGPSFSPDETVVAFERQVDFTANGLENQLYFYDLVRGAATEAFARNYFASFSGMDLLALDDRVAYLFRSDTASGLAGLYFVPVVR
jgi:hypothetical protein